MLMTTPERVRDYELLGELGRGGMGTVHLARQIKLDRRVALKQLSGVHAADAAFAARFLREARLAGSLNHPHIVAVHQYFEHDGVPYIAMDYLPNGSLRPHIGKLTLAQIAGVLEDLLSTLAHEHHERPGSG